MIVFGILIAWFLVWWVRKGWKQVSSESPPPQIDMKTDTILYLLDEDGVFDD